MQPKIAQVEIYRDTESDAESECNVIYLVSDDPYGRAGDWILSLVDDESYMSPFQLERDFISNDELIEYGLDPEYHRTIIACSKTLMNDETELPAFIANISPDFMDYLTTNKVGMTLESIDLEVTDDDNYKYDLRKRVVPFYGNITEPKVTITLEGAEAEWFADNIFGQMVQAYNDVILINKAEKNPPAGFTGILIQISK